MNELAASAPPAPGAPTPLRHVIYSSRASTDGDAGALTDILVSARARNAHHGITGVLIYFDKQFLQYLEGPPAALEDTLRRIRNDPRHRDVVTLADGPAERRLFSKWTMGIIDLDSEAWERLFAADWPHAPGRKEALAGAVVLRELAALHHDPEPALVAAAARRRDALEAERTALKLLKAQTLLLTILLLVTAVWIVDAVQT